MAAIYSVGSIGNPYDEIPTTPLRLTGYETVGHLDLLLAQQRAELEQGIAERISGIGSPVANSVNREMLRYRYANSIMRRRDLTNAAKGNQLLQLAGLIDREHLAGIGFFKKLWNKAKETVSRVTRAVRQSNLIKKVGNGLKAAGQAAVRVTKAAAKAVATGAKAAGKFVVKSTVAVTKFALKAVTAPMRLFAKGLLEVLLPKMSQFFLYLFVTNPATIATLPPDVQAKRRKAEKFARFIIDVIGMRESHFLSIVRNGIMKQTKQTPEQLLAVHIKGSLSGIGIVPLVAAIIPLIPKIIEGIAKLFGKKPEPDETPTAQDVPDAAADFGDAPAPAKRELLTHLRYKPASQQGYPAAPPAEEEREARQETSALQQVQAESYGTPVEAPLPTPYGEPSTQPELLAPEPTDYDLATMEEAPAGEEPQF